MAEDKPPFNTDVFEHYTYVYMYTYVVTLGCGTMLFATTWSKASIRPYIWGSELKRKMSL